MRHRLAILGLTAWAVTGAFYEWGGAAARGVRELRKGQSREAVESLREGRRELPQSAAVRYDQALAFRGVGLQDSALKAYADAMSSPELRGDRARSAAAYNLGNESMREEKIDLAKRLYREALRTEPGRVDAKKNLEEAIRRLRNQKPPSPSAGIAGKSGEPPSGPRGGGAVPEPGAPPGEPPRTGTPGPSPGELGREIPSRAEAEHWLDALEAERQAARERERAGGSRERGQRDW